MNRIKREHSKYLFVVMFVAVAVLTFFIIKPFITSILVSTVLAYVFYPLYKWVNRKIKRKRLASIIVSFFIILLITLPIIFILNTLSREAYFTFLKSKQVLASGVDIGCDSKAGLVCNAIEKVNNLAQNEKILFYLEDSLQKLTNFFVEGITNFIFSIPKRVIEVFVTFFMLYYLFIDGESFLNKIRTLLPLKKEYQDDMFKKIKNTTRAIIYGYFITGLIQGGIGALGFFLFGLPSPFLWSLFMIVFALIPLIGTPFVWIPAAAYLFIKGRFVTGILFLLYNLIFVINIDNIIKPKLISMKTKVHPILILLGILGGFVFFGFIGFIIGPLVLGLLINFINIYQKEN